MFLRGRALALAQRFALYARDELAMSTLRIRVRTGSFLPSFNVTICVAMLARKYMCMHV